MSWLVRIWKISTVYFSVFHIACPFVAYIFRIFLYFAVKLSLFIFPTSERELFVLLIFCVFPSHEYSKWSFNILFYFPPCLVYRFKFVHKLIQSSYRLLYLIIWFKLCLLTHETSCNTLEPTILRFSPPQAMHGHGLPVCLTFLNGIKH